MLINLTYWLLWLALLVCLAGRRAERSELGWFAGGSLVLAWVSLTAALVMRGMAGHHWPFSNRYEYALCWLWAILALSLLLEGKLFRHSLSINSLIPALVVGTYAITRSDTEKEVALLLPVLRSIWFQLHVLSTLIGFAALSIAAGMGLETLLNEGGHYEHTAERITAIGFTWLTLGILCGAMWAQNAWGRYWGWDIKEIWSLVTWLWYLLILHLRSLPAWRGRRLYWLMMLGFGVLLFTFIGVPWLVRTVRLESLHGW